MKKINIFIITLILIITLGVTKLTPNAIITVNNNAYELISVKYNYEHGIYNWGSGNIYYDKYNADGLDFSDLNITSWSNNNSALSFVYLNKSLGLGIDAIPLNQQVTILNTPAYKYAGNTTIIGKRGTAGGNITYKYYQASTGTQSLDITSDYLSDYFAGVILTYLIDSDDTLTIKSSNAVLSIIQYINNNWYVTSYPQQYIYTIYQGLNFTYLYSLGKTALKEYNQYTNLYILNYEKLSGASLYDETIDAPNPNATVWNDNGVEILNYLSDTVGTSFTNFNDGALLQNEYNSGLQDGQIIGYENGYNKGLQDGSNVTTNWIATISQGVGHVLALEIAPNLPLGLLVAIPLVLGMLGLILHFWRKD